MINHKEQTKKSGRQAGNHRGKKRAALLAAVFFTMTVVLSGCGSSGAGETTAEEGETSTRAVSSEAADPEAEESSNRDVFAMDTFLTLTAYGSNREAALDAAEEEIERIENRLSTGIETSEIAQLNENGSAEVSEETMELIERSVKMCDYTDGRFDVTIYPLKKAWGFPDENYRVPDQAEITELLALVGVDKIHCDAASGEVTLDEGTEIDLGGIAKGYAANRLMEVFEENGVDTAIVSLGGDVKSLGEKPDGTPWRVAIEKPDGSGDYLGILSTEGDTVVFTSGGYERYFEEDGKRYHHILDPDTGSPSDSGLSSVTIVCEDGVLADSLSTALFIMGEEEAENFWREHAEEFDAVLVEEDGAIHVTEGIAEDFSCDEDWSIIEF